MIEEAGTATFNNLRAIRDSEAAGNNIRPMGD